MPGPYGITQTGFNSPTFEEIQAELRAACRAELGATIDVSPESVLGQFIDIVADREVDLWQLAGAIIASAFPESATGLMLQRVAALTRTLPKPPTYTQVTQTLTGTPGTVINNPRVAIPGVPDAVFAHAGTITLDGGGSASALFVAVNAGPISAPSGTVTQIDTPVAGWTSTTNPLDQSQLGTRLETDPEFRLRRVREIRAQGGAAFEAMRAALLKVANVQDVFVFENTTQGTVDTIPPNTFEVVVRGGTDADIAETIYRQKPLAIGSHGTTSTTTPNSQGDSVAIKFTRPTLLNVYMTIDVVVDARAPSNVATLIAAAVVARGDLMLRTGSPVVGQQFTPTVFGVSAGVHDVALPKIGTAPGPVSTATLTPTRRQIADLDTSRVVVNVTRI